MSRNSRQIATMVMMDMMDINGFVRSLMDRTGFVSSLMDCTGFVRRQQYEYVFLCGNHITA